MQQLVPVQLTDEGPGVVIIGDISRVLLEDVPHDLIDGVISLLLKGVVYGGQHLFDLRIFFITDAEFASVIGLHTCRTS